MPNVKIVDNVILGANSIVTKDILESGVYIGQPLRKIKTFEQYCVDCVNFYTNYPWDNLLKKRKDNKALLKIKRMNYIKTKLD